MVAIGTSCLAATTVVSKTSMFYRDDFPFDWISIDQRINIRIPRPTSKLARFLLAASGLAIGPIHQQVSPVGRSWMVRTGRVTWSNKPESCPISRRNHFDTRTGGMSNVLVTEGSTRTRHTPSSTIPGQRDEIHAYPPSVIQLSLVVQPLRRAHRRNPMLGLSPQARADSTALTHMNKQRA